LTIVLGITVENPVGEEWGEDDDDQDDQKSKIKKGFLNVRGSR
jgi:hypothetical protein